MLPIPSFSLVTTQNRLGIHLRAAGGGEQRQKFILKRPCIMANKSIVVYGGTLAGVAAAAKAAGHVDLDKTDITLIVPDPVNHNGNRCL